MPAICYYINFQLVELLTHLKALKIFNSIWLDFLSLDYISLNSIYLLWIFRFGGLYNKNFPENIIWGSFVIFRNFVTLRHAFSIRRLYLFIFLGATALWTFYCVYSSLSDCKFQFYLFFIPFIHIKSLLIFSEKHFFFLTNSNRNQITLINKTEQIYWTSLSVFLVYFMLFWISGTQNYSVLLDDNKLCCLLFQKYFIMYFWMFLCFYFDSLIHSQNNKPW